MPKTLNPSEDRKFSTTESSLYLSPEGKLYPAAHSHWDFAKKYIDQKGEDPEILRLMKAGRQINIFDSHIELTR